MSAPTAPGSDSGTESADPDDPAAPRTVDLFVRSLSPSDDGGHAETAVAGLRAAAGGAVDEYTIHVWGDAVSLDPPLSETDHARFVRDRVAEFRAWAADREAELVGFETRESRCRFTDHDHRALALPAVALAEYHGDDLVRVAPCRTPDGVLSVGDRVEALAAAGGTEAVLAD